MTGLSTASTSAQALGQLHTDPPRDRHPLLGRLAPQDPIAQNQISSHDHARRSRRTRLVDCHNELGIFHTGKMLDSAGDPDGHVQYFCLTSQTPRPSTVRRSFVCGSSQQKTLVTCGGSQCSTTAPLSRDAAVPTACPSHEPQCSRTVQAT